MEENFSDFFLNDNKEKNFEKSFSYPINNYYNYINDEENNTNINIIKELTELNYILEFNLFHDKFALKGLYSAITNKSFLTNKLNYILPAYDFKTDILNEINEVKRFFNFIIKIFFVSLIKIIKFFLFIERFL